MIKSILTSAMMKRLWILILTLVVPLNLAADNHDKLVINFKWPRDTISLISLSRSAVIRFDEAEIEYVSPQFMTYLTNIRDLYFGRSDVKKVYIESSVEKLDIRNSQTEEILISNGKEYELRNLTIRKCNLINVPNKVNMLKKLRVLDLQENKIKYINMNIFDGLRNLASLDFGMNELKQVTNNNTVFLPALEWLNLGTNVLEGLDMCQWNMPVFKTMYVDENKINVLKIETDKFDKLKCMQGSFCKGNSFDIVLENCQSIPNDPKMVKALENITDLNKHIAALATYLGDLTKEFTYQRSVILEQRRLIEEQGSKIDDLIEIIYRSDMGKEYGKYNK